MIQPLIALLLVLTRPPVQLGDSARTVVRAAARAVEGDTLGAVEKALRSRLARDARDRSAALALATIARLTYRYDEADRLTTQMLGGRAGAGDAFALYARLGRAASQLLRLELASAESAYVAAWAEARRLSDRPAEIDAMIGLAEIRRRRLGPSASIAMLDTAFRLAPDSATGAAVWCSTAFGWSRHYDLLNLAQTGVAVARARADPRLESDCELALAREQSFRRNTEAGGLALLRAADLARRAHDRQRAGAALRWIGSTYRLLGQHERALKALREGAAEAAAASDRSTLAYVELNLGLLSFSMHDMRPAEQYAVHAAELFDRIGDREGRASVRYLDGAIALARDDSRAARASYNAGLDWANVSQDGNASVDMHLGLSVVAIRERRWQEAERELDAAARIRASSVINRRAALAITRGDLSGAERAYKDILAGLHSSQHDFRYEARSQLALISLRQGDLRRAETELAAASEELDAYRASLSDAELRLHAVVTTEYYGAPPDPAEWVIAALAKEGRLASAFALTERRRARELLERLARGAVLRGTAAALRLHQSGDAMGLDALVSAIPDDRTAVLEYVASSQGAPTTLLVATRAGTRGYVLAPLDSLQKSVGALETLIEAGATPRPLARRLGDALVAPALRDVSSSITRLLVIPDGPLHHVPWDALVMADGRFLVERYAIATAPSSAVAMELWRRPGQIGDARILALGDPRFADEGSLGSDQTREIRNGFATAGGLPRLPESGGEAREVGRFALRSEVRVRERASEAYLKRTALDSFTVIHLATHALVDEESISRTALALSPGDGEDGFLGPGDLAALHLRAQLVVLSACRTARGPILGSEGVQGLTAPLLQAGARSIVATGWRIGDARTRRFMTAFYGAVARGEPVADALRSAKLLAVRSGEPPQDWAAFALVGDPLARVMLRGAAPGRRNGYPLRDL